MKKAKKLVSFLLGIIIVLIVIVIVALLYSDQLIKLGVETAGTQATGSATTLDNAKLSIAKGQLSLAGLKIANPAGYQTDQLLNLGKCTTAVNIGSLMSDTIEVSTIELNDMVMTLEQKGLTSNLTEILDQIKKKQPPKTDQPKQTEKKPGKKVKVNLIEIKGTVVRLKLLPVPGQKDVAELKLGDIKLENVTPDDNKAEMLSTVIQKVLVAISEAVVKAGGDILPADLQKGLNQSIESVQALVGELSSQMSQQAENILKEGGKAIEDAKKGLGDVLKTPGDLLKPKDQK